MVVICNEAEQFKSWSWHSKSTVNLYQALFNECSNIHRKSATELLGNNFIFFLNKKAKWLFLYQIGTAPYPQEPYHSHTIWPEIILCTINGHYSNSTTTWSINFHSKNNNNFRREQRNWCRLVMVNSEHNCMYLKNIQRISVSGTTKSPIWMSRMLEKFTRNCPV